MNNNRPLRNFIVPPSLMFDRPENEIKYSKGVHIAQESLAFTTHTMTTLSKFHTLILQNQYLNTIPEPASTLRGPPVLN